MANFSVSFCIVILFIFALLSINSEGTTMNLTNELCQTTSYANQKMWCVAKPSTDESVLMENMNFACSEVSCVDFLQEGCPCYYPNTLMNHASVAMNLYYQAKGSNLWNCDFKNSALLVQTDPSYGMCNYT